MAKYIKQEVPDMKKTGEQKVFYRLKVERNVDFEEFIREICSHHRGISRGEALRVLVSASEVLAKLLGEGYSVSLQDWEHSRLPSVWKKARKSIPSTGKKANAMPAA